ncbi:MAG: hypothetical protein ABEH65_03250 [Halobacteriales archaeon]
MYIGIAALNGIVIGAVVTATGWVAGITVLVGTLVVAILALGLDTRRR